MRQTYAAGQTTRAGTKVNRDRSRNGMRESDVRLRMVPAPGGVAFVEDKPAAETSPVQR